MGKFYMQKIDVIVDYFLVDYGKISHRCKIILDCDEHSIVEPLNEAVRVFSKKLDGSEPRTIVGNKKTIEKDKLYQNKFESKLSLRKEKTVEHNIKYPKEKQDESAKLSSTQANVIFGSYPILNDDNKTIITLEGETRDDVEMAKDYLVRRLPQEYINRIEDDDLL